MGEGRARCRRRARKGERDRHERGITMSESVNRRAFVTSGMAALAVLGMGAGSVAAFASEKSASKDSAMEEAKGDSPVDTVSSASTDTNKFKNMDQATLMTQLPTMTGLVAVATTNEDGSPNLAVFIPSATGEKYVYFGFAPNATQANLLRDKQAVLLYDEYDLSIENPSDRHYGCRAKVKLVEDPEVLEGLKADMGAYADIATVVEIVEVLPMG